jgi:hypothetical protein
MIALAGWYEGELVIALVFTTKALAVEGALIERQHIERGG